MSRHLIKIIKPILKMGTLMLLILFAIIVLPQLLGVKQAAALSAVLKGQSWWVTSAIRYALVLGFALVIFPWLLNRKLRYWQAQRDDYQLAIITLEQHDNLTVVDRIELQELIAQASSEITAWRKLKHYGSWAISVGFILLDGVLAQIPYFLLTR